MIVVCNVERSQFKVFDLRVTLKELCKLSIHFDTPFQIVIEEHATHDEWQSTAQKDGPAIRWNGRSTEVGRAYTERER